MTEIEIGDVVVGILKTMAPLSTDERRRAFAALQALLGDEIPLPPKYSESIQDGGACSSELPSRASVWMKQNGITSDELEQIFHIQDGTVELIAPNVPGNNDKDRTINTYVLCGILKLLQSGSPEFDDGTAKDLCKKLSCLNSKHHAEYIAGRGNELTGSKEKGWTLTSPGLRRGAELVKGLVSAK
jgi:hypothetical protein